MIGVPFVNLKTFPGALELKQENDAHSDPIIIPRGLLFGRTRVTSAYVSLILFKNLQKLLLLLITFSGR